jgi:MFS family permease
VSGPLIGGVIVDTPWLGWRWCFGVGVPVAVAAFAVLQKTLHLPTARRQVRIDYLGAALIAGGVSLLLLWVSLAGTQFEWLSTTTAWMVALGLGLLVAAVVTEMNVAEPIIPMRLFADRTTSLATLASTMVGIAMFGATVFLSQYFQISRGMSPTHAGLMSTPMVGALMVASLGTGRAITATGRWKRFLVGGMVLVVIGLVLLSTIDESTSLWEFGAFMAVLGAGMGAAMQNLVLAVQNNTAQSDMGAASSLVAFFRTLGGSIGVSALGAALGHQVGEKVLAGLTHLGVAMPSGSQSESVPDLSVLPAPVRAVFEQAYGEATAHIFLMAAPVAALALLAVLFIKEVPLRRSLGQD